MTEREHGLPSTASGFLEPVQGLPRTPPDAELDAFSYRIVESPLDDLLVARTAAGLVRVAFAREGFPAVIHGLSERLAVRVRPPRSSLDDAARAIDAYFTGGARTIPLPVDLQLAVGFRRSVAEHLPTIGYGTTASYAAVAAALGRPRSANAVGVACRGNPLPIVLPCHRVVRSDGNLGDYIGGREAKRLLLALEAA